MLEPKVFEVARCDFEREEDATASRLRLPTKVRLQTRQNRVVESFECIQHQTSDESVRDLVLSFSEMTMFVVGYAVADIDGSLMWSEISSLIAAGCLWRLGMTKPGVAKVAAATDKSVAVAGRLLDGDPFAANRQAPSAKRLPNRRGSGHPAASQGRKRRLDDRLEAQRLSNSPAHGGQPGAQAGSSGDPVRVHQEPHPLCDEEMDLADDELASLPDSDQDELLATYIEAPHGVEDPSMADAGPSAMASSDNTDEGHQEGVMIAEAMEEAGLGAEVDCDAGDADPAGSGDEAPLAQDAPPPPSPWSSCVGPSQVGGYVYDGGRSILRIQRGGPAKRVTISCFRHPSCSILVNESRAPPDLEIFQSFFEVEATTPEMSGQERRGLTARHKALARARWTPHPVMVLHQSTRQVMSCMRAAAHIKTCRLSSQCVSTPNMSATIVSNPPMR